MGDELVGEDGGVGVDFDEVDAHGGDFGEHGAAEGVGEGEVDGGEDEVDAVCLGLYRSVRANTQIIGGRSR